jgi:hypothetical protein
LEIAATLLPIDFDVETANELSCLNKERRGDTPAQCLGGFEVDHELEAA